MEDTWDHGQINVTPIVFSSVFPPTTFQNSCSSWRKSLPFTVYTAIAWDEKNILESYVAKPCLGEENIHFLNKTILQKLYYFILLMKKCYA